jgi:hypothetical protein
MTPYSPTLLYIVYVYKAHLFTQRRGGGELTREKVREAIVHKPVENTNMTGCISSLEILLSTSKDDI